MAYKNRIETANGLGVSANSNFDRIVSDLQDMAVNACDADRSTIDDAVLLLQQQRDEIESEYEADRA